MGWRFTWVSSFGSAFIYDFQATATPKELAKGEMFYNFKIAFSWRLRNCATL
jgi:predicted dithiol-disulfide oxidoreductase (DUF899 family)